MNLTIDQQSAVHSTAANILVVAGPGSGKTATTVQRIARLLNDGVAAKGMVAITFTNAAARELETRITAVCGDVKLGYVGTLHGFALKMMRLYGQTIGFGDRLSIISEDAIEDMLAARAQALGCKTPMKKLLQIKASNRHGAMEKKLGQRLTLEEMVIKSYYEGIRMGGMVDFDTILSEFLRMLVGWNSSALDTLGFSHLFVDEVQDSAAIDWEIYWALPVENRFFVGDQDQSIYAFRGGRPDLMGLRGEGEMILLEDNFRSHSEICDAAQLLIEHNPSRIAKRTLSAKGDGGVVNPPYQTENAGHELSLITASIREVLDPVVDDSEESSCSSKVPTIEDYESIAVIARTNAICHEIRKGLKASGIPVVEEKKPDLPPDWKRTRLLIELMVNPKNHLIAWMYAIATNIAKGMKPERARAAAHVLNNAANSKGVPLYTLLPYPNLDGADLRDVGHLLSIHEISAESKMRVVSIIKTLGRDAEVIDLALAMNYDDGVVEAADRGVTVTTFHGAKGREWDTVIIAGLEDETMPGRKDVEENRRLMYVGVTRARKRLYFTWARSRVTSWGAIESHTPSRFFEEMGLRA